MPENPEAQMLTAAQEADLLRRLLKKRSPEKFAARELGNKAHWRWNRGGFVEAAVLFAAAATRSADEVKQMPVQRDNTFNYRVRAGVTFRLAGEVERAWPILLEATSFDWQAAGIPEDSHFTEWAFVEMLCTLADRNDRRGFSSLFWQAVARCEQLGARFPRIQPKQDLLLDLCERLELSRELIHVIDIIESQRKMTPHLAKRVARLRTALPTTPSEKNP
jgi:hypothetical protein